MIISFGNKQTEALYHGSPKKLLAKFPSDLRKIAARKLDMMNAAICLKDLTVPPSNHLEKLKGDYSGYYSIRINDQWRIIFKARDHQFSDVTIIDYH